MKVTITGFSKNHVDATVVLERSTELWRFTGYYGHPKKSKRKESWSLLKQLAGLNTLPWVLMGDINDLLLPEEKRSRHPHPQWLIRGFREVVEVVG